VEPGHSQPGAAMTSVLWRCQPMVWWHRNINFWKWRRYCGTLCSSQNVIFASHTRNRPLEMGLWVTVVG